MTEVEYIVASMATYKEFWLRKPFGELFDQVLDTTMMYSNKKSVIRLAENLTFHDKSKHIEIRYYYIWDMV